MSPVRFPVSPLLSQEQVDLFNSRRWAGGR